jgi:hypothetical protein
MLCCVMLCCAVLCCAVLCPPAAGGHLPHPAGCVVSSRRPHRLSVVCCRLTQHAMPCCAVPPPPPAQLVDICRTQLDVWSAAGGLIDIAAEGKDLSFEFSTQLLVSSCSCSCSCLRPFVTFQGHVHGVSRLGDVAGEGKDLSFECSTKLLASSQPCSCMRHMP